MEPSPKRPRIQAVELSPTPKILPLATSDLLPDKNGNAPVPPSEPELITGEVTLGNESICGIYFFYSNPFTYNFFVVFFC